MKKLFLGLCLVLGFGLITSGAWATTAAELNDAVMFFVNDPQCLTFTDMNKLVERNRAYQTARGTVSENQIAEFFKSIQDHGVKDAGTGANQVKVAYVVQNQGPEIQGVIVLKGQFDEAKVLETMKKHYGGHSKEHETGVLKDQKFAKAQREAAANPFVEADITMSGHAAHVFPMPLRNREFIVISSKDYVLMSSAKRGARDLLTKTIAVVDGKLPLREAPSHSKVVMTFAPDSNEKKQMEQGIWARYDQQKKDSISQKKHLKKMGERFRQKVIKNKVEFFCDALDELQEGTLTIERDNADQMTKVATLVTTHQNAEAAAEVKKRLMKHMIKEIKRNDNVEDKFALGNVSITTRDNQTVVRCQLKDSKEQLHAFNLISSYVAKGLLERL